MTVVDNVVDNAIDATDQGGRVVVLVVSDPDGAVRVRVDDDGPGVPDGDRDRVFEVGMTTKDGSDGRHGRGIGLAFVARIAVRPRLGQPGRPENSYRWVERQLAPTHRPQ